MYDLGDTIPLTTEVLDAAGVLTAASGVACTIGLPDGTSVTPTVSSPSTGRYTVDYVPTLAGRHSERWTSTTPATARSDTFDVRAANPGYIFSLADAKAHLNLPAASTTNDEELRGWIEACTEVVEELAGRVVARRTVTEKRTLHRPVTVLALGYTPVVSLTSVVDINGYQTWTVGEFDVDADSGIVEVLRAGTPLYGSLRFTYVAGYPALPAKLVGAAKSILRHLWETQRSTMGGGQRTRLGGSVEDTVMVAGYAVPRAASELIGGRAPGFA